MKKFVFPLAALLVFVLVAWWAFDVIQRVNTPAQDEIGVGGIQSAKQALQTTVEYGDYVYVGGKDGLVVGDKRQTEFKQYITQNPVQNIELGSALLQYEEWNEDSQTWEVNSINLKAYSQFLETSKE